MRVPLLLTLCLAACGAPTVLDGKAYSKSCTVAADCVAVVFGDQCQPCTCPNAAIASSDKVTYEADRSAARAACGPVSDAVCAACQAMPPVCSAGVCGL